MSKYFLLPLFCAAACLRAQTTPATPPPGDDRVQHLDTVIVSAGPDPRTAFDLAQGTSVLAGDELRHAVRSTLGDSLATIPGVSSTAYGPGASRPIIRGLGGDRIRVLTNGIGALDASNVSPDHNTAVEPLFASRVEVLRGPSTLLYGSSAVGGVVNVIDQSIPTERVARPFGGTLELRTGGATRENAAVLAADAVHGATAVHVNALTRDTDDLRIPGIARIDPEAPGDQPRGTLPGSATQTKSVSAGLAQFWDVGRAGVAVSHYETEYGVPTGDDPATSIRLRQNRLALEGDITRAFGPFRGARVRLGIGDYEHSELSGGTTVNTTFKNRAWEGRLELPHVAIGPLLGTVGAQAARSDFSAVGEEVATPPYVMQNVAIFALEEMKLNEATRLELGARAERQTITLGDVPSDLPEVPGYAARPHERNRDSGLSASFGVVHHPAANWTLAASLAYTQRLPAAQERYSNGPHAGTAAYEIGTHDLAPEKCVGVDLSLRRRSGRITGAISVFAQRFQDYVFEQELAADAVPDSANPDGLTPYQFVARDARFLGGEAELSLHLLDRRSGQLHLDLSADYVRAQTVPDDVPLPRMPPWRTGARLTYATDRWTFGAGVRRVFAQHRVGHNETPTPGYTLLDADVSWRLGTGRVRPEVFVHGENLANAEAREHTSFLKAFAPLAGRGVTGGVRLQF